MDKELVWLMVPVFSALYIIGGWKQKNWRRLGLPLSLLAFGLLFSGLSWQLVASSFLLGAALRLPFTLIGDSVHSSPWNWVWIWVLGAILGISSLLISQVFPLSFLLPMLMQGVFGTASNLRPLSQYTPWKMVEAFVGASVAYPYCLALS